MNPKSQLKKLFHLFLNKVKFLCCLFCWGRACFLDHTRQCSEVIRGSALRNYSLQCSEGHMGCWELTPVSHVRGKHTTWCTIALTSMLSSYELATIYLWVMYYYCLYLTINSDNRNCIFAHHWPPVSITEFCLYWKLNKYLMTHVELVFLTVPYTEYILLNKTLIQVSLSLCVNWS